MPHLRASCLYAKEPNLTAVALGRGKADIIVMMGEQGIFHTLTMMLLSASTTEITASCLASLAGTSDTAGREAQVPELTHVASSTMTKPKLQSDLTTRVHKGS